MIGAAVKMRILIADDHPVMRQGLRAMLEQESDMEVIGEAGDGAQAIALFQLLRPDVALIDLQMPKADGLQAITAIRAFAPTAVLVVLTTYPGDARVNRALSLGATSYILKTASSEEISGALRGALTGKTVVAPTIANDISAFKGMEPLSARELSVLRLVALGNSNRSIGQALNISEETVKTRIKNILAKLGALDRTHAVTLAVRRGFLDG
jgi:DNA-binding NarL/FixJ family response regulator